MPRNKPVDYEKLRNNILEELTALDYIEKNLLSDDKIKVKDVN